MTILDYRPAGTQWHAEPIPVAYPTHAVNGWCEGEKDSLAVVQVAISLTRDELLTALDDEHAMAGFDADQLSVQEIRAWVEQGVSMAGAFELGERAARFWGSYGTWTAEEKANVAAMARAIDRAYPAAAISTTVVNGTPSRPSVACTACPWTVTGEHVEPLMADGVSHSATHGER
ncbi:hypothetical protein [Streptantibioticus silvisoli]|uniref:Uncharacterized protein n=1 Tax=Streptantibioticus silvisoli TaxID=2705255 RepID=A0ABT6W3F2_9ACTN|nr:hypothetical protein [Streptantibioticus silvisoli]MDI5964834.1 hypothetical protein [Streptantibioticus silvisoli]